MGKNPFEITYTFQLKEIKRVPEMKIKIDKFVLEVQNEARARSHK